MKRRRESSPSDQREKMDLSRVLVRILVHVSPDLSNLYFLFFFLAHNIDERQGVPAYRPIDEIYARRFNVPVNRRMKAVLV